MIFYSSTTGLIHLIFSCLALVFGTLVLLMKKGTRAHRLVGYVYVTCMTVLLLTAFMIYDLFGGFGIFHLAAIVGSVTLILGIVPAIRRKKEDWAVSHLSWMYWSVLGLYAAFVSEVFTRYLPMEFFSLVGIGTGVVMILGGFGFYFNLKKWKKQFGNWP